MSREWLRWMSDFVREQRHVPTGAVVPFYITAANVLDGDSFLQSGPEAGLGVGMYEGWAICNGNNGTINLDGKYPRFKASGAAVSVDGVTVGAGVGVLVGHLLNSTPAVTNVNAYSIGLHR